MDIAAAVVLIINGLAIAAIWTRDIVAGDQIDLSQGLLAARDPDSGTLFWPHWLAEYATAAAALAAGVGLFLDAAWAPILAGVAAGALLYTSVNSLGWALAKRDRFSYAVPMFQGVVAGAFVAIYLFVR